MRVRSVVTNASVLALSGNPHIGGVMPVEQDSTGITAVQSGDGAEQRRFARAVAPDKGCQFAFFYGGFHLAEQSSLAVAYGKIV